MLQNNYFHIFPAHWATAKNPQKIINVLCTWHVTVNQVTARENCIEESTSRLPGNVAARTKHLHGRIALVPGDWTVNQGLPSKTCRAVLIDLWKHHQTRKIKNHPRGKKNFINLQDWTKNQSWRLMKFLFWTGITITNIKHKQHMQLSTQSNLQPEVKKCWKRFAKQPILES